MRIADNVEMLKIDDYYLTLLWDDENLVLVDAGLVTQHQTLVDAIKTAGHDPAKITHIIFTHHDMDHVGGGLDMLKVAPNAVTLAHIDEVPYINGDETPTKLAAHLEKYATYDDEAKAQVDASKELTSKTRFPIKEKLNCGDVLPICGGIEIIHTPGHTPGHICLYLQESQIMVLGDAALVEDGKLVGFHPQYIMDMELADKSIEKIKKYPMKGAVVYHGGFSHISS
ncbi:MAG: MBL fold metallo-hydrolase [Defluviitaleaceae bacterium]|nr:MBL fold metallo-hydrolase [Defluviitaleaceae bacterium]